MPTKVVKLSKPVLDGEGNPITELVIPDPDDVTIGQLGVMDDAKGDWTRLPLLIAALCNIPISSAKAIRFKDLTKVDKELADFMGQNAPESPRQ